MTNRAERMMEWLEESPCNFMAIETITKELESRGYIYLDPTKQWHLIAGERYYTTRNGSAVFAFRHGTLSPAETGFRIIASHSDSPGFKLKPRPEIISEQGLMSFNVEKYGGPIMYTWFDRPLSLAGRVMLEGDSPLSPQGVAVDLKDPICTIPHLAIHFNRSVNEGNPLSVQKDMKPVVGRFTPEQLEEFERDGGYVNHLLYEHLGRERKILSWELMLYPVEKPTKVGADGQYFQSGRIDDLSMAFASLEALLAADTPDGESPKATQVMAIFDNEETGSATKQGAASPTLSNLLMRICGGDFESYCRAIERSFLVSADNAHGWHPNYSDKYDPVNHPVVGGGPVIKVNANCKYMTDADGSAVFASLCEKAGVNCQYFVNHADVAGGSTLGNILTSQIDLRGVDMGCAIWAMHSAAETGAVSDYTDTVKVFTTFYQM